MNDRYAITKERRRSRRSLTTAGMGAAVSLLLGSGLLAVTSDSIRSDGNAAQSGTLAPTTPESHDLVAALVDNDATCDAATALTDGPLPVIVTDSTAALSSPGATFFVQQFTDACLRNDGTATGSVVATFDQVLGSEVGSCETSESGAGDTNCTDGDPGEFEDVIAAAFRPLVGNACSGVSNQLLAFSQVATSGIVLEDALAPGETCRFYLQLYVSPDATEQQRLTAQTDRVQWDIVLTLQDVIAP